MKSFTCKPERIHSCPELIECVQEVGFLPLLESGVGGFCAEALVADECRYTVFPDGSWEWPLWQWKGAVIREGDCVYGKLFGGKAGFVSRSWWPDLYNWRRSQHPAPAEGTIEDGILSTLRLNGSMITRELRAACDFTNPTAPRARTAGAGSRGAARPKGNMRSKFDAYITRLQMGTHIITEDFVYPTDKHGREYGFGWALLTTPEHLLGHEACRCERSPEESLQRMTEHLAHLLPAASEQQIMKIIR